MDKIIPVSLALDTTKIVKKEIFDKDEDINLRNFSGNPSTSEVHMQPQFQPKIFIENEDDFLSMAKKCCSNKKYQYIKKKLSRKIHPKITPNNTINEIPYFRE